MPDPFKPNGVIPCGENGFFAYQQTGPAIHGGHRRNPIVGKSWGPTTYARLIVGFRTNRTWDRFSGVPQGAMVGIEAVIGVLNYSNQVGVPKATDEWKPVGYTIVPQLGSYVPQEFRGMAIKDIPAERLKDFGEPGATVILFPDGDRDLSEFFARTNRVGLTLVKDLDQEMVLVELVAKGRFVCTGAWQAVPPKVTVGGWMGIDFEEEAIKAGVTDFSL